MIVHEGRRFCVIHKPAGLLSQKDESGDDSLVQELQKLLKTKFIGLIHRLDRNTSGLMLIAKDPETARVLTEDLQNDRIVRRYQALLLGKIESPFSWSHYLEKNPKKNHVTVFRRPSPNSKKAHLTGHPLKVLSIRQHDVTLVELELQTGRSHQIRSQASFENHPVIGDHRYGKKLPPALQEFPRPALHSSFLSFTSPDTKEKVSFESALSVEEFVRD